MIRYAIKCSNDHAFDAWFASSTAYDGLRRAGQVTCPDCGSDDIEKALMTPGVPQGDVPAPNPEPKHPLARLRAHVEANADYVGTDFATRARAMHDGTEPHRPIYGETALPEARKLVEDGVPIAPLPFVPKSKVN